MRKLEEDKRSLGASVLELKSKLAKLTESANSSVILEQIKSNYEKRETKLLNKIKEIESEHKKDTEEWINGVKK